MTSLRRKSKRNTLKNTGGGWIPFRKSYSAPLAISDALCAHSGDLRGIRGARAFGLNFCDDCKAEFEEFVSVAKGKKPLRSFAQPGVDRGLESVAGLPKGDFSLCCFEGVPSASGRAQFRFLRTEVNHVRFRNAGVDRHPDHHSHHFRAGKLPEIGSGIGKGIKNFKKATQDKPMRSLP